MRVNFAKNANRGLEYAQEFLQKYSYLQIGIACNANHYAFMRHKRTHFVLVKDNNNSSYYCASSSASLLVLPETLSPFEVLY